MLFTGNMELSDAYSLSRVSYVRAGKLFTAHESLFRNTVGQIKQETHGKVVTEIVKMLS